MVSFLKILKNRIGLAPFKYWSGAEDQKIYVVDTNLFFECRVLKDLPWSELAGDDIVLLVTQYVLDEIEKHKKGRKTSRTKKRSIGISSRLRPLIVGQEPALIIQEESPRVSLRLETLLKPSRKIEKTLDLSIIDNKIVGCVDALQSSGLDASILSHDGNAVSTANSLSLPATLIPDHWLLELQDDDERRENKKLQKEIDRLEKQEPQVTIFCVDGEGEAVKRAELKHNIYLPLNEDKVSGLIGRLETEILVETDYGSEHNVPKPKASKMFGRPQITIFEHATTEKVNRYRDEKYPEWVSECREYLTNLHSKLHHREDPARLFINIENVGTRPAKSTLVEFEAKGSFSIKPPPRKDDDDEDQLDGNSFEKMALPSPPTPPRGHWKHDKRNMMSNKERLRNIMGGSSSAHASILSHSPHIASLTRPHGHDPDAFYWKDGRPIAPRDYCSLTCDNWRHAIGTHSFTFELYPEWETKNAKGAFVCEIHAENTSNPKKLTVPIEFVTNEIDIFKIAENLVDEVISRQRE